jgi:hypothetical protein
LTTEAEVVGIAGMQGVIGVAVIGVAVIGIGVGTVMEVDVTVIGMGEGREMILIGITTGTMTVAMMTARIVIMEEGAAALRRGVGEEEMRRMISRTIMVIGVGVGEVRIVGVGEIMIRTIENLPLAKKRRNPKNPKKEEIIIMIVQMKIN